MKKKIHICLILWLLPIVMVAQDSAKKVGLVWDTSYGMINRNLEAEINYLNDYFLENRETEVLLTIFSNTVLAQESYKISNAEWTELRDQLETSIPDGATSFTNIFPRNVDEILLFTDGKSAYGSLPTSFEKPITVVYSVAGGNQQRLQDLADNSGGKFINLLDDKGERNKEIIKVTGTVSTLTVPLEGVRVESRELGVSTTTDKNGKYEIEAAVDGSIRFSLLGKKTYVARTPPDGKRNIILEDGNETLDEILITADRRPEEKSVNLGVVKRPE
ncbi:MAG: hypothetical protein R3213_02410, partial [Flavobacteriaceae bacterium]|nr:hypothetical protein [Flavobacteriaceae bacterium]